MFSLRPALHTGWNPGAAAAVPSTAGSAPGRLAGRNSNSPMVFDAADKPAFHPVLEPGPGSTRILRIP